MLTSATVITNAINNPVIIFAFLNDSHKFSAKIGVIRPTKADRWKNFQKKAKKLC